MAEAPSFLVVPFSQMSPAACAIVAQRVAYANERFDGMGLSRRFRRRLLEAQQRLEAVAQANSYGDDERELRETAEALAIAIDFFQLAGVLSSQPGPVITHELASALEGGLLPQSDQMGPLEFQTQYWFGMVLAHAGLSPGVPLKPKHGPHVDFHISVDSQPIAVEVKRPQSIHSAHDAMDRGAGQLRGSRLPGLLAVDLSQCLGADRLTTALLDYPSSVKDFVRPHFMDFATRLADRPRKYNQSDKYARVLCTIFYARVYSWQRFDMSQPQGSIFVMSEAYPAACAGLLQDQTTRLRNLLRSGFGDISGGYVQPI